MKRAMRGGELHGGFLKQSSEIPQFFLGERFGSGRGTQGWGVRR